MAFKRSLFAASVALSLTVCGMAQSATIFDNPANQFAWRWKRA